VSREEGRRSRGAIGWMKSIVEWRDGGAADARGRQIHGRVEKVGTSFCLHFVLFSSRDEQLSVVKKSVESSANPH
jgi:hypothetical protein